jgi:arylsulfatase A-like enzyme
MSSGPHVIYVISDQHRGQAMGHTGDANVRTPVMDRLAAGGVSMVAARANCPVCTPSRGTIFSGRHAHAGPVQGFWDVYKATAPSTATMMRAAGYHTAYFGKWHCGAVLDQKPSGAAKRETSLPPRMNPFMRPRVDVRAPERHRGGFQDWRAWEIEGDTTQYDRLYYQDAEKQPRTAPGYEADAFTDLFLAYLDGYNRDEPLFGVLSLLAPHFPLEAPAAWCRHDPQALTLRGNAVDGADLRHQLATYYAMVENLDWNLGRVVERLQKHPRFSGRTVIVYLSDHGEFLGSHGYTLRKDHPHEEAVRVPVIFHGHGITAQGPRDDLFSLVDLAATTLGLAGVTVPDHVQGRDFSPRLRGEAFAGPDAVLLEMVGNARWTLDFRDWRGLVTDRWKYAHYETGEKLLFDLAADPLERSNLAGRPEHAGTEAGLRRKLLQLLRETREPYFDVLIEHGADCAPTTDVSGE